MSTAHTCFRSALTQAFRPSTRGAAASCSVPAFLVPALARSPRHHFSTGKRCLNEQPPQTETPTQPSQDGSTYTYNYPPKPGPVRLESCIPIPSADAEGDIEAWLNCIDPFLPFHLQRAPSDANDQSQTVTPCDLALFINAAQHFSLDILGHLGLAEGRWQVFIWMAKKLVEDGRRSTESPPHHEHHKDTTWSHLKSQSLNDLTEAPILVEPVRRDRKGEASLDDLTAAPDTISPRRVVVKRALGQLWRTLGSMILAGAEQTSGHEAIMPHVLEVIAHLHHVGLMPESVYRYQPHENKYALQQPPTLHMMSSKILSALSDASWKAHEAAVKLAKGDTKVSYFLGHEIPGSRYRVVVSEVAPELWLELVLWSCLHGGWTLDGLAILESLATRHNGSRWGLVSWREILLAEAQNLPSPSRLWKVFNLTWDAAPTAEDRARLRKKISSEVVVAFVDALVNGLRLGVGARGVDPDFTVRQLKLLKDFLDADNLSLGVTAWDAIMARLLESGAFIPEKRPEVLLRLFKLAPGFGGEVETINTSSTSSAEVPYFFEPTTFPLGLLHRTMRAFITNGDIKGATDTITLLQQYTDDNKQKSLHAFFEMLKRQKPRGHGPFTSRFPPIDYPAFETSMPVALRAKLLDLATDSEMYDLGRWCLFAEDLDGPFIGRDLYNNWNVAASIVRFGTLAGENDLVLDIVKRYSVWDQKQQQSRMPLQVLNALLCSQIMLRRWKSVSGIQEHVADYPHFRLRPIILSTFAGELLRLTKGTTEELSQGQDSFTGLLFAWEAFIMDHARNELYCVLAMLSTIDHGWKQFCSPFLEVSLRQEIKITTSDFNLVLQGVLDGYGSRRARSFVDLWCYTRRYIYRDRRAPGGLPRMPRFLVGRGEEYDHRPKDIEIVQKSGPKLCLQGRVRLNRQTLLAVLRTVEDEVGQHQWQDLSTVEREGFLDTIRWAARLLLDLGYDAQDVVHAMGSSLAELAGLEVSATAHDYVDQFLDSAGPGVDGASPPLRT